MSTNKQNNFVVKAKLAIMAGVLALSGATAMADVLNPVIGPLLYEENFNTLDSTVWNSINDDGCGIGLCGWGNKELEFYRPANLSIDDVPFEAGTKALAIQAKREASGGKPFTSGKITTEGKLQVKYGMIEFRMSTPQVGTGLWPAGWMLGTTTQKWPAKGELDIMEMGHKLSYMTPLGSDTNSYTASNAIFYAAAACVPANPTCAASTAWQTKNSYVASAPLVNRFVIYRMYWTNSQIRFTVIDNGVEHDMYNAPIPITAESSEFNAPFYFLFNLAVGGDFTDAASADQVTAPLPSKMYIDYVRVYQLNGMGEVKLGNQTPKETGVLGIFTDRSAASLSRNLIPGVDSDIWVWNGLSASTMPAYEGANVLAWNYTTGTWFGGSVTPKSLIDMSNFAPTGTLKFHIKIPANVAFKIGIKDNYTNESWVQFPANQTKYGLVRDGEWREASIPVSEIRGQAIALQAMTQLFMFASDGAPSNFQIGIDDVVWDCGTDAACFATESSSSSTGGVASSVGSSSFSNNSSISSSVTVSSVASSSGSSSSVGSSSSSSVGGYSLFVEAEDKCCDGGNVTVVPTQDLAGGGSNIVIGGATWVAYTDKLNVPVTGTYEIEYRVASTLGGSFISELDGGQPQYVNLGTVNVPATGSGQVWLTITQTVTLTQGAHAFGINTAGGWSLNWFRISSLTSSSSSSVSTSSSDSSVALSSVSSSYVASSDVSSSENSSATSSVIVVSSSSVATSTPTGNGYTITSPSSVQFYSTDAEWSIIHYTTNGANQQNVTMTHNSDNTNTYDLMSILNGTLVDFFFTVKPVGAGAYDSAHQSFTMVAVISSSSSSASSVSSTSTSTNNSSSDSSSSSSISGYNLFVEAEDKCCDGGNVTVVPTQDPAGGGSNIVIGGATWVAYTDKLNVPVTGTYEIEYRVASTLGSSFTSELDGGQPQYINLGAVTVPATGSDQVWLTITQTVTLAQGPHAFGINTAAGGWSLNWFRISSVTSSSSSSSSSVGTSSSDSSVAVSSSSSSVDVSSIAASSVAPSSVAASSVAPSSVAASSVAPSSIAASSVAPSSVAASSVAPSSVAASSVAPSSVATSSVTPSSVAASSVAASSIAPNGSGGNEVPGSSVSSVAASSMAAVSSAGTSSVAASVVTLSSASASSVGEVVVVGTNPKPHKKSGGAINWSDLLLLGLLSFACFQYTKKEKFAVKSAK